MVDQDIFQLARWLVVRASALQLVDLEFISQVESNRKILKSREAVNTGIPCLSLSKIGIVWRTSRQVCLLCPWARHLTGCLHLHVAERWWDQAVYPSWWPRLTEDSQTEHKRSGSVCTSSCIMLRINS